MTTRTRWRGGLWAMTLLLAACGTTTTQTSSTSTPAGAGTTARPATTATTATTVTTAKATTTTTAADPKGTARIELVTTSYGSVLGRGDGKVLYAWEQEADGVPRCLDACAEKWPPLLAGDFAVGTGIESTLFALVKRPDGTQQVTLKGKPLYTMIADAPGEANCQGLDGWWLLNADGSWNKTEPK